MSFSRRIGALVGAGTSKPPPPPVNEPGDGFPEAPGQSGPESKHLWRRGGNGVCWGERGSVSAREEPRVGGGGGAAASGESDAEQRF